MHLLAWLRWVALTPQALLRRSARAPCRCSLRCAFSLESRCTQASLRRAASALKPDRDWCTQVTIVYTSTAVIDGCTHVGTTQHSLLSRIGNGRIRRPIPARTSSAVPIMRLPRAVRAETAKVPVCKLEYIFPMHRPQHIRGGVATGLH